MSPLESIWRSILNEEKDSDDISLLSFRGSAFGLIAANAHFGWIKLPHVSNFEGNKQLGRENVKFPNICA